MKSIWSTFKTMLSMFFKNKIGVLITGIVLTVLNLFLVPYGVGYIKNFGSLEALAIGWFFIILAATTFIYSLITAFVLAIKSISEGKYWFLLGAVLIFAGNIAILTITWH